MAPEGTVVAHGAGGEPLGVGEVDGVHGRLGQDGLVRVDFGTTAGMDSGRIAIAVAERATAQNQSMELAAGASLAFWKLSSAAE